MGRTGYSARGRPPARTRRRPPLLLLAFLLIGAAIVYGDSPSTATSSPAAPGRRRAASECTGGREYPPAIRCRGTWIEGGSLLAGGQRRGRPRRGRRRTATSARRSTCASTGPTTRPSRRWARRSCCGGWAWPVVALGALGARRRGGAVTEHARRSPARIRDYLVRLLETRWSGRDAPPPIDAPAGRDAGRARSPTWPAAARSAG